MYVFLPRRRVRFLHNLAGAAFSAGGWVLFSYFFSLFVENFSNFSIYGSLATLIILMFWLFFCMYILFLGGRGGHVAGDQRRGRRPGRPPGEAAPPPRQKNTHLERIDPYGLLCRPSPAGSPLQPPMPGTCSPCATCTRAPKGQTFSLLRECLEDLYTIEKRWQKAQSGAAGFLWSVHRTCYDFYAKDPKARKKAKPSGEGGSLALPFSLTDPLRAILRLPGRYKTPLYLCVCRGWTAAQAARFPPLECPPMRRGAGGRPGPRPRRTPWPSAGRERRTESSC